MFMPEIPDHLTPWDGTKPGPPEDWNPHWKVMHRGDEEKPGYMASLNVDNPYYWEWDPEDPYLDIVAYHSTTMYALG